MARRTLIVCLAAALAAGCAAEATRPFFGRSKADLEAQLAKPGLSLTSIGVISNDLGEKYEEEGARDKALAHYRRAVWAFTQVEALTGERPVLLDDALDNLARIERR